MFQATESWPGIEVDSGQHDDVAHSPSKGGSCADRTETTCARVKYIVAHNAWVIGEYILVEESDRQVEGLAERARIEYLN